MKNKNLLVCEKNIFISFLPINFIEVKASLTKGKKRLVIIILNKYSDIWSFSINLKLE